MKTIGLTGSIGSGKTTVSKIIESLGYPVFNSDLIAKEQLEKPLVIKKIVHEFGEFVLTSDKTIDKKILANNVFNNPLKLNFLNSLIHPLVIDEFNNWKLEQNSNLVFMESALIFEHNLDYLFDKIICVFAPENVCIDRCYKRDNLQTDEIKQRLSNQMSPKIKCEKSDFVISNDDFDAILPQIFNILSELKKNHKGI